MSVQEKAREPVATAGAGERHRPRPSVAHDHPYREQLMADPDFFWRRYCPGYRLKWSPELRRKATERDILDLRGELEALRGELEKLEQRTGERPKPTPSSTISTASTTKSANGPGQVKVPRNVRRSLRQGVRR